MNEPNHLNTGIDGLPAQKAPIVFSWLLVFAALVFLSFNAWASISTQISSLIKSTTAASLRDFTVWVYIGSWVFAMGLDLRIQNSTYRANIRTASLIRPGVRTAIVLIIIGACLIFARQSTATLTVALDVLFISNFWAWLVVCRISRTMIESTRLSLQQIKQEDTKIEELDVLNWYLAGRWHPRRFTIMFLLIIVTNVLAFSTSARNVFTTALVSSVPSLSIENANRLLPDLSILTFVIVAELWSWATRLLTLSLLSRLRNSLFYAHPNASEYLAQFFDQRFKAINYLMISHGAAILATMTVIKDVLRPDGAPKFFAAVNLKSPNSIGSFMEYFSWGLALAVLAYITLSIARDSMMHAALLNPRSAPPQTSSYAAWTLSGVSALLLLAGTFTVASQVSALTLPF